MLSSLPAVSKSFQKACHRPVYSHLTCHLPFSLLFQASGWHVTAAFSSA